MVPGTAGLPPGHAAVRHGGRERLRAGGRTWAVGDLVGPLADAHRRALCNLGLRRDLRVRASRAAGGGGAHLGSLAQRCARRGSPTYAAPRSARSHLQTCGAPRPLSHASA